MMKKHILIVPSELYLPSGNKLSGIFQQHHAELLQRFGNRVGVISAGFLPLKQVILRHKNIKVENIEGIKIYRSFLRIPMPARINIRLMKSVLIKTYFNLFEKYINENGKPDIIHAHNCLYAGLAAVKIKEKYKIPLVVTEHSSLYGRNLLTNKQLEDAKLVLSNCDYLTVVSNSLGESLKRRLNLNQLSYQPIYNVLDIKLANESFLEVQKANDKFTFLSVGSLDDNKNHRILLIAFAAKFKNNHMYRLHIGGEGPMKAYLTELAEKLNISNQFKLCGHLNREELIKELSNCNVMVSTSKLETFGVALVEALSFGKPIISTDSGGPRDIVDSINGILVKNNDVLALSSALEQMVLDYSKFNSEEIRKHCLNKFDSPIFYKRLQEIYFKVNKDMKNNLKGYRRCVKCVMDTTDTTILFNEEGVCSHCTKFETQVSKGYFPNEEGRRKLEATLKELKKAGAGKEYDCIIGLSGGVDSCYLALKVKEWNLRPLVVHVDTGWNSELAVANINKVIDYCGYELFTHVIQWDEMRDLQVAYLKSGVANQDVPQDHAIFATIYHFAVKHNINCILTGGNIATEGVFPDSWQGNAMDAINLRAIHKKHGNASLKTYNTISLFEYYIWYPFIKKMRTIRPLNFMEYNKQKAIAEMEEKFGWRNYGRKHGESIFTKLFQNYYQPQKFGYDKRLPHLSSLIVTGQISRELALDKLKEPLYAPDELENDIAYFCRKLDVTRAEFDKFITDKPGHYTDFKNSDGKISLLRKIQGLAERIFKRKLTVYS